MDRIFIRGLRLYAYHGVNPEEKQEGQPFVLDITCKLPLEAPCRSDSVEDTVSYAKVVKTARAAFLLQKYDLLERAAQAVADAILTQFPRIAEVTVCLKKPFAPIQADFDYVAVELTRAREDTPCAP